MSYTVVITAINRRIGHAMAVEYLRRGAKVLGICNTARGECEKLDIEVIDKVDVKAEHFTEILKERLHNYSIDLLINNIAPRGYSYRALSSQPIADIEKSAEHLSSIPIKLTRSLSENLSSRSKTVFLSNHIPIQPQATNPAQASVEAYQSTLYAGIETLSKDHSRKGGSTLIVDTSDLDMNIEHYPGDLIGGIVAEKVATVIDNASSTDQVFLWDIDGNKMPLHEICLS